MFWLFAWQGSGEEQTAWTSSPHPLGSLVSSKLPEMQMLSLNFVFRVSGELDAGALTHRVRNSCRVSEVWTSLPWEFLWEVLAL